ncbi:MAG: hypothetical protein IJJ30_07635 [Erysipelotrichaceae bacterium]|nr:hypothetical protein [Erysipelotrichaceae bacterium]MBR2553087.1 hypothetical protein [Erysipelotrichaceae bacterium]
MKIVYTVQANGVDTSLNELEKQIKSALVEKGLKQKDINTLNVYFKPVEQETYVVAEQADGEVTFKL